MGADSRNGASTNSRGVLAMGIIGFGNIGRIHLDNLKASSEAKVVAIADQRVDGLGALGSGIQIYTDWRELIESPAVDAVIICLPHYLHAECAELALQHGKHVFLEKPLATSLQDAQRLAECAKSHGCLLMVNMTHRFYPPVRKARELIRAGAIGDVVSVRDHYMEVIDRSDFPAWFFDPIAAGGGVAMTDAIHLLDRVTWLLGEDLELIGQTSRRLDPDSIVEDAVEILCRSKSGISVVIGSFFCFDSQKTWSDQLTIFGTKGSLSVHAWDDLEFTPYGQPTQHFSGYDASIPQNKRAAVGHKLALEEFLTAVREGRSPEAEANTVMNAQKVVQDFYDKLSQDGSKL